MGELVGVLPLVRQKSLVVGDFLTSIPFFNYGGALADMPGARSDPDGGRARPGLKKLGLPLCGISRCLPATG